MLEIICKKGALLQTNMYLLKSSGHSIVIDPRPDLADDELDGTVLDYVLLTHEHYDHICGVNLWREQYHCPVWCGKNALKGLRDPRINMSHYGNAPFELMPLWDDRFAAMGNIQDYSCEADVLLDDGQVFCWQGNQFVVLDTPGHSPGSISYLVNNAVLFCGDTLLPDVPTGVRWRGGNEHQFREVAVPRLMALNKSITVFPGHGESFCLRDYTFWEEIK